jgi:Ca2+-binding EF-hand superfamily protein
LRYLSGVDEDKSGKIEKAEFCKAVQSLGFSDITDIQAGKVFDSLDDNHSGTIEYKELNEMLRRGTGSEAAKRNLQRHGAKRDDSRGATLNARNLNKNFAGSRVAALPPMVKLDASSGESIPLQLKKILDSNSAKLVDVFREWDTDGNGAIDKKEFRKAVAALGYEVPKRDLDQVFDEMDDSGDGFIEYSELKSVLRNAETRTFHAPKPKEPKEPKKPKPTPAPTPAAPVEPEPEEVDYEKLNRAARVIQARCRGIVARNAFRIELAKKRAKPKFRRLYKSIVGERVRIYWERDDAWFSGIVTKYKKDMGWHVEYDSPGKMGTERWHGLVGEQWEVIER